MNSAWVLDSSGLLALIDGENGAPVVAAALNDGAAMSAVNWSEVAAKLGERGSSPLSIQRLLTRLSIEVVPFDELAAYGTAFLRVTTRQAGLSLGDRACLALALHLGVPALTADRAWQNVQVGVTINLIR